MMAADDAAGSVQAEVTEKVNTFFNMPVNEMVNAAMHWILGALWKLVLAIVVYYVGRWIIKKIIRVMGKIFERREIDSSLGAFLVSLVNISLMLCLVVVVIGILGIETSSFLALFAAAGVAVGMALSGTLQNFAGGVMILLLKPFRVGDYIEAQGQAGKVKTISIFNTVLTTAANETILVPNGSISTSIVKNKSAEPKLRLDMKFGIAYGDNIEVARDKISALLDADPRVLKTPPCVITVAGVADNVVILDVKAWVKNENYSAVLSDINEKAYRTLSEKGKDDQPPQNEIHLTSQA